MNTDNAGEEKRRILHSFCVVVPTKLQKLYSILRGRDLSRV